MPRKKVIAEVEPEKVTRQVVSQSRTSNTGVKIGAFFITASIIIGGAILLGKSDRGEIDVNKAIESSNQANIAAGGDPSKNVSIVSESVRDMPNGGLVPQENQPPVQTLPPEQPSTTASTTEQASTTDATKTDETEKKEENTTEGTENQNPQ